LIKTIRIMDAKLYLEGRITRCYDVTKKLADLRPNEESIRTDFARISILNNDYVTAAKFAKGNMGIIADFEPLEKGLYDYVDKLQTEYQRELKLRKAEAEADDLPRVKLKTTKGDIVIELFENEAPETVANFINLVEIDFYDEIIFNPVYQKLLAQTGAMTETMARPTGYTIYDEFQRKDARRHFRGSVCLATDPDQANSGCAVFYILHVPGPHLVRDTVFGRVISDMDVVDSLQPTKEFDDKGEESWIMDIVPDKIISAEVIRKRDHEYVPNRVKETSESSQ
jgi:cyclophilin family peptidyl-prolyl cis-trans isomerase